MREAANVPIPPTTALKQAEDGIVNAKSGIPTNYTRGYIRTAECATHPEIKKRLGLHPVYVDACAHDGLSLSLMAFNTSL